MARRIRARLVLQLSEAGLSGRRIAATQGVSRNSVSEVLAAAREAGIGWREAEAMTDAEVYGRLFPGRALPEPVYPDPDWERVHRELARVGVTPRRLHAEYRDEARAKGEPSMSYDRFCKRYREFTVGRQVVSRVGHKAGRVLEVDWAGPTTRLVDPATGEVSKVFLFVACLPLGRPVLRRADAGHERGYMAPVPRARVRLHRRLDALHSARQPQGRREGPPARGRGRAERGLSRDGRPLRVGRDAGARQDP